MTTDERLLQSQGARRLSYVTDLEITQMSSSNQASTTSSYSQDAWVQQFGGELAAEWSIGQQDDSAVVSRVCYSIIGTGRLIGECLHCRRRVRLVCPADITAIGCLLVI